MSRTAEVRRDTQETRILVRVDLDGDRATVTERWDMGERIRALAEAPDGAIWVLEDGEDGRLLELTPA